MKKYGKKWRALHPELASKPRANDIQKIQEEKRLRQTPWDKSKIKTLQQEAYALIPIYLENEVNEREEELKRTKRQQKETDVFFEKIDINEIIRRASILYHPPYFVRSKNRIVPLKNRPLKDRLECNASEFIQRVNATFEISVSNIDSYLFHELKYDIETNKSTKHSYTIPSLTIFPIISYLRSDPRLSRKTIGSWQTSIQMLPSFVYFVEYIYPGHLVISFQ
jgi:hypothetical protein